MFKWLKSLLGFDVEESEKEVVTETEQRQESMSETQTVKTQDLKKLLQERETLARLQTKLVKEKMLALYQKHYRMQISGDAMNRIWGELVPKVPTLFSMHLEQDPQASIETICETICEAQFHDALSRTTESAKRIIKEDVLERLERLFSSHTCDPYEVAMLGEKILLAFDAIEKEEESCHTAQEEASAAVMPEEEEIKEPQEKEDETLSCIDSFIKAQDGTTPSISIQQQEEELEEDLGEETTEPQSYLTADEKRFIELYNLHPHYTPAALFHQIHQEKQAVSEQK